MSLWARADYLVICVLFQQTILCIPTSTYASTTSLCKRSCEPAYNNPHIITCMSKASLPANLVYIIPYHYLQNWNVHVIEFPTLHLDIYHTILLLPMQVPLHYANGHANPRIITCMSKASLPANLVYFIP